MARRTEPRWLSRVVVDAIHADQLRQHGGLPGVRDENALESALARPRQRWAYAPTSDLATLAAAYAFGLVRNHPYCDGNKRMGFLALATFLGINGREIDTTDEDVVTTMLALAEGSLTEAQVASGARGRLGRKRYITAALRAPPTRSVRSPSPATTASPRGRVTRFRVGPVRT